MNFLMGYNSYLYSHFWQNHILKIFYNFINMVYQYEIELRFIMSIYPKIK